MMGKQGAFAGFTHTFFLKSRSQSADMETGGVGSVSTRGDSVPISDSATSSVLLLARDTIVDYRVRLSVGICAAALVMGLVLGQQPHKVSDYHDFVSDGGLLLILCGLGLRSWAAGVL